jgi:hypothetical protein
MNTLTTEGTTPSSSTGEAYDHGTVSNNCFLPFLVTEKDTCVSEQRQA